MGRPAMLPLARRLRKDGFVVNCFGYNTITGSLQSSADKLAAALSAVAGPVALVGHSLGGLVALQAAQQLNPGQHKALVLLGSPYQGARAAKTLRTLTGGPNTKLCRALHDWMDLASRPTVQTPVFTLSGNRATGLGRLLCKFDEPNDGTVTVAETHYPDAVSCLLPVSHTEMLFSGKVAKQVSDWLRTC